jgi:hypothetical protein
VTGWATPVTDAFAGGETTESPLDYLLSTADDSDLIHKVVTDFDRNVDRCFMAAKSSDEIKDKERNQIVAWYGAYLLRLYAVANGIPAFEKEVTQWTYLWFSQPQLPTDLKGPMETLLLPRRDPTIPSASLLLPLFDSRTLPIQGSLSEPRLAILGEAFDLRVRLDGDSAQVVLEKSGDEIASIECDFPLVREALSCAEGHLGITEFTHTASPRLERLRASQLRARQLNHAQFRVVTQDKESSVQVVDV